MTTDAAVGRWVRRDDGGPKGLGKARYKGDLRVSDMLHARLVLSPYPHAGVYQIDLEDARKVPGVVDVNRAEDLPLLVPDDLARTRDPLARGRVFFEGQPIVAVVAES